MSTDCIRDRLIGILYVAFACVCACVCVCIYIYIYVCMYSTVHVHRVYVCMYAHELTFPGLVEVGALHSWAVA
jgi:hypothetical protein